MLDKLTKIFPIADYGCTRSGSDRIGMNPILIRESRFFENKIRVGSKSLTVRFQSNPRVMDRFRIVHRFSTYSQKKIHQLIQKPKLDMLHGIHKRVSQICLVRSQKTLK